MGGTLCKIGSPLLSFLLCSLCTPLQAFALKQVDYLGINISSGSNSKLIFKIYYNNKFSRNRYHPLIEFLQERDMVRYVTMVHDKKNYHRSRYDVGLKNRTNENMEAVFEWLSNNTKMFSQYYPEIEMLSHMKVTEKDGYEYSGLYFLGFISEGDEISLLKTHYFNRLCDDPDVLHKNIQYADEYYLSFLNGSEIESFKNLTKITKDLLKYCGGHLWMTGADFDLECHRKYKIYVKNPEMIYEGLLHVLNGKQYIYLQRQLKSLMDWNRAHHEFYCEGFAVCEDEIGEVSINFYFRDK